MKMTNHLWSSVAAAFLCAVAPVGNAQTATLLFSGFHEELGLPAGVNAAQVQTMRWQGVSMDTCEIFETGIRLAASNKNEPTLDVHVLATARKEFNGIFVDTLRLKPGPFTCAKDNGQNENFVGYYQTEQSLGSAAHTSFALKKTATLMLKGQAATLELIKETGQMTIMLVVGTQRQLLKHFPTEIESVGFGLYDIDRDGKLDILCSFQTSIEAGFSVLYLSSFSKPGAIVGEAAIEPR